MCRKMSSKTVQNRERKIRRVSSKEFKRCYFSDYAFPVSPTMRCHVNLLSVAISMNQLYFWHR